MRRLCYIVVCIGFVLLLFNWIYREEAALAAKQKEEAAQEAKRKEKEKEAEESRRQRTMPPGLPSRRPSVLNPAPGYKTVLGKLNVGTKLYRVSDYRPYGIVTAIEWGRVEVALMDTVSVDTGTVRGNAVWLDRSYVTENCVTKE